MGLPASLPKSRVVSGLIGSSGIDFNSLSSATRYNISIFKSTSLSLRMSRSRLRIRISESFSRMIHICPSASSLAVRRAAFCWFTTFFSDKFSSASREFSLDRNSRA